MIERKELLINRFDRQEYIEMFKKLAEEYKNLTPGQARRILIDEGIFNEDGTLHENYGGLKNDSIQFIQQEESSDAASVSG